jgi:hypothetical protein
MDEDRIRDALMRHWQFEGIDYDKSHEVYHEDAVLEFPQSGERFVGRENFLTWRKQYPAKLDFRIRKITHDGDLWVTENVISYDGGPWMFTLNILRFRGDRIAHERLYVMDGWVARSVGRTVRPTRGHHSRGLERTARICSRRGLGPETPALQCLRARPV